jgi:hypothetical protein
LRAARRTLRARVVSSDGAWSYGTPCALVLHRPLVSRSGSAASIRTSARPRCTMKAVLTVEIFRTRPCRYVLQAKARPSGTADPHVSTIRTNTRTHLNRAIPRSLSRRCSVRANVFLPAVTLPSSLHSPLVRRGREVVQGGQAGGRAGPKQL